MTLSQRQTNVFLLQGEALGLAGLMDPALLKLLGTRGSTALSVFLMISSLWSSFEVTRFLPNVKLRIILPFSRELRFFIARRNMTMLMVSFSEGDLWTFGDKYSPWFWGTALGCRWFPRGSLVLWLFKYSKPVELLQPKTLNNPTPE